jgi:hypothetical protein
VAVLEVLLVGTGLQVLLEAVATVGGGDGRDVDALGQGGRGDGRGALGHGCGVYGFVWLWGVGVLVVKGLRGRSVVLWYVKKEVWELRWGGLEVGSHASSGEDAIAVAKVASLLRYV